MSSSKPTALGAHIFTGLFTRGILDAGFEVLGHLEEAAYGTQTAALNFPGMDIRIGKPAWRLQDYTGKVDFLYSNCACAAWSTMRHGGGEEGDDQHWTAQTARLGWIEDVVAAALVVRPKAFAWESVAHCWSLGYTFVLEQAHKFTDAGYTVTVLLQDNRRFGVPQRRKRMFLLAHKHPLAWYPLVPDITVRMALDTLPKKLPPPPVTPKALSPFWTRLWTDAEKHGGHLARAYEALSAEELAAYKAQTGGVGCYKPLGATLRIEADRPAPVMLSGATRYHPDEPRHLSYWEWLALCGLPMSWQTAQRRYENATVELARAVMPGVGMWLGRSVRGGLSRPALTEPQIRLTDLRYEGREIYDRVLWRPGQPRLTAGQELRRPSAGLGLADAFSCALGGAAAPAEATAAEIRRLCF